MRKPGHEGRTELKSGPTLKVSLIASLLGACNRMSNRSKFTSRAHFGHCKTASPVAVGLCGLKSAEARCNNERSRQFTQCLLFARSSRPNLSGILLAWRLVLGRTCPCPGMTSRQGQQSLVARIRRDELATHP